MADHHDVDNRDVLGTISEDDPLAELARIIGYERPDPESRPAAQPASKPDSDVFDLEAELLRELNVPAEEVETEAADAAPPAEAGFSGSAGEAAPELDDAAPAEDDFGLLDADSAALRAETEAEAEAFYAEAEERAIADIDAGATEAFDAAVYGPEGFEAELRDDHGRDAELVERDEFDGVFLEDLQPEDEPVEAALEEGALFQALEAELAISEDRDGADAGIRAESGADIAPQGEPYPANAEESDLLEVFDAFDTAVAGAQPQDQTYDSRPTDVAEGEPDERDYGTQAADYGAFRRDDRASGDAGGDDLIGEDATDVFETLIDWPEESPPAPLFEAAEDIEDDRTEDESAEWSDELNEAERQAETLAAETEEDEILAELARFDIPEQPAQPLSQPVQASDAAGDAAAEAGDEAAATDFEDELSAELDIYREEINLDAPAETAGEQDDAVAGAYDPFADAADYLDREDSADVGFDTGRAEAAAEDDEPAGEIDLDHQLGSVLANAIAAEVPSADAMDQADDDARFRADDAASDEGAGAAVTGTAPSGGDRVVALSGSEPGEAGDYDWPTEFDLERDLALLTLDDKRAAREALEAEQIADRRHFETTARPSARLETPVRASVVPFPGNTAPREKPVAFAVTRDMGAEAFDAGAIQDPDQGLAATGEIDVPRIPFEDETAPVNQAPFESEIEQEFADLVEQESQDLYGAAERPGPGAEPDPGEALLQDLGRDLDEETGPEPGPLPYRPRPVPVDADAPEAARPAEDGDDGRGRAPVIAGAVLGAAVLFGGLAFGWSWFAGGEGGSGGEPPIIRADTEPVKVVPENPGGLKVPNQDKAVYDRVAGNQADGASQPKLVTTAEEPVDVVQRTLDPDILPLEGRDEPDVEKVEDRLTSGDETAADGTDAAPEPMIAPRKVRTMIVRPDGTIVAREEPAPAPEPETASADAARPAAQPAEAGTAGTTAGSAAPAAGEAPETASRMAAATPSEPSAVPAPSDRAAQPAETVASAPAENPAAASETEAAAPANEPLVPLRTVETTPIRPTVTNAPVPTGRPADQPVTVVSTVTETGRVAGTDTAAASPAAANPGGYYVQIASQPTAEGAQASYANLSSRYASIIGGRGVDIQRADIPGKGVFHRVRVPAGDRDSANALCARYKAAGGSCFVTR